MTALERRFSAFGPEAQIVLLLRTILRGGIVVVEHQVARGWPPWLEPKRLVVCAVLALMLIVPPTARAEDSTVTVDVKVVADEPLAVLAILEKRRSGATETEADWTRLFSTDGYRRLKKRELAMRREFADDAFREFVISDALASRHDALAATPMRWNPLCALGPTYC